MFTCFSIRCPGEWFDVSIEADTLATLVARATARATQESGLLSQRIKRLRDKKGWNQTELADRAAVQQSLLSKIEKGSRPNPTIDIVRKLAQALGCTTDYLIGVYEDDAEDAAARTWSRSLAASDHVRQRHLS